MWMDHVVSVNNWLMVGVQFPLEFQGFMDSRVKLCVLVYGGLMVQAGLQSLGMCLWLQHTIDTPLTYTNTLLMQKISKVSMSI